MLLFDTLGVSLSPASLPSQPQTRPYDNKDQAEDGKDKRESENTAHGIFPDYRHILVSVKGWVSDVFVTSAVGE